MPVVCLPGLARMAADFHELALHLSGHRHRPRRVLALDYRGRGLSAHDVNWRNYDIRVEMQDVLSFIAAAGIEDAIFIGTSRGGLITMAIGAARPSIIKGVVLNDVGPLIEAKGLVRIRGYVGKLPVPRDWNEAIFILRRLADSQFPILTDAEWDRYARRTWREENGRFTPWYDVHLMKPLAELDLEKPLPDLWPYFHALNHAPVLAIRGANSDLLSAETLAEMQKRHPACQGFTVPGQGHAPQLGDALSLNRIASFIASVEDQE
jgi:pimeloyl-ACP methyl ester carboxylesterase